MQNYSKISSRGAFSLMELMIVIIILGLLASLVLPNLMGKGEEAKRKIVCVQMATIAEAINMFKTDNSVYPSTEEGLQALITNPSEEDYPSYGSTPYMKKLPQDSWKKEFIYINKGREFDLISLGADRKEGGEEEAKDIRFSECQ
ncbi:MAG: type II secretion system major pseudopilin GspG [Campylobacterota bacterium]